MHEEFSKAIKHALARMADVGNDLSMLPIEFQTIIRLETMQGIIDNGGLQYFYENDFPGNPPYEVFVDDLIRIDAHDHAEFLKSSIECFDIPDPHLDQQQRNARLAEIWGEKNQTFIEAENKLCGNKEIWIKLNEYVMKNQTIFS